MYKFYNDNNLKVLFNTPYISHFNMIELVFRFIKNITYKSLYSSIDKLKKEVVEIIEGEALKNSLPKLYRETLSNYIKFIEDNKELNLDK